MINKSFDSQYVVKCLCELLKVIFTTPFDIIHVQQPIRCLAMLCRRYLAIHQALMTDKQSKVPLFADTSATIEALEIPCFLVDRLYVSVNYFKPVNQSQWPIELRKGKRITNKKLKAKRGRWNQYRNQIQTWCQHQELQMMWVNEINKIVRGPEYHCSCFDLRWHCTDFGDRNIQYEMGVLLLLLLQTTNEAKTKEKPHRSVA